MHLSEFTIQLHVDHLVYVVQVLRVQEFMLHNIGILNLEDASVRFLYNRHHIFAGMFFDEDMVTRKMLPHVVERRTLSPLKGFLAPIIRAEGLPQVWGRQLPLPSG